MLFRELIGISLSHNTHHQLDFSKLLNANPYKRALGSSPFPQKNTSFSHLHLRQGNLYPVSFIMNRYFRFFM